MIEQRSVFVDATNSLIAGRTGTRLNIGRPQIRWSDGTFLASTTKHARTGALVGKNAITVASRIKEAVTFIRANLAPS